MTKHQSEAERRAQILAAAREEFVSKGFASARVEDVAKRARLSKGAVYFYFPSKRDLFMALVLEEHERSYSFLEQAEAEDRPALGKLLEVGRRYLTYFAGLDKPPRFFLMMTELSMRDEALREECAALHQRFVDATTRIFAQGIAEGAFREMAPMSVAQLLKGLIDGFAGQAAIGVQPDTEHLVREGFELVLRGILREPELAPQLLAAAEALSREALAAVDEV